MNDLEGQMDLARQRTELAIQRNVMAIERTFSAWIRTGVSSVLAGLAIVKFIGERDAVHFYVILIGVIFVSAGILIYMLAYLNFKKSLDQMEHSTKSLSRLPRFLFFITLGMVTSAVLILLLLFVN